MLIPTLLNAQEELDYRVYSDTPRLLLRERRLRLLKRERERQSLRWQQFASLMEGHAAMPEAGFAAALYGAVAESGESCHAAVRGAGDDGRQQALVLDWCGDRLSAADRTSLVTRLRPQLTRKIGDVVDARTRAFAALALADIDAAGAEKALRELVEEWWKQRFVPVLKDRRNPDASPEQIYALLELAHVLRDNLKLELREMVPTYFEELPALQMLATYPAPWPAVENEYRIPVYAGPGDPDLRQAALSRAASLSLVAFDTNAQPQQFLQGWLLLDRFLMRSAFGITYEFLWANPYQPGLSYYYMPDVYQSHGRLLVRSSWDEDAAWFGFWNGKAQSFQNGQRSAVKVTGGDGTVEVGDTRVYFARAGIKFSSGERPVDEEAKKSEQAVFVLNLAPNARYDVETDGEEMLEARSDEGGIIALKFERGRKVQVRVKPAGAPPSQ